MNNNKTGPDSSGGAGSEGTFAWIAGLTPAQWKIFGATFSAWTFAAINILLFSFVAVSVAEVFSLSPEAVGWFFSAMLFSAALGGILFGVVSDYAGRGISALAPPLAGYVAGMKGDGPALVTVSVFAFAAALVVLALPETKGKELEV